MNKILIAGLITFTMVALAGSAVAWKLDVEANVTDADVDISAGVAYQAPTEEYVYTTTAGVDGSGTIEISGSSNEKDGKWDSLKTTVTTTDDGTLIYATQTMLVAGCLVDCGTTPCDCPGYLYYAASGASINGQGEIELRSDVVDDNSDNEQKLRANGEGDFTAGMLVYYQVEGEKPVAHAMGAYGVGVSFCAKGETDFNTDNGQAGGYFGAKMNFQDEGCPCPDPECPECPCECLE